MKLDSLQEFPAVSEEASDVETNEIGLDDIPDLTDGSESSDSEYDAGVDWDAFDNFPLTSNSGTVSDENICDQCAQFVTNDSGMANRRQYIVRCPKGCESTYYVCCLNEFLRLMGWPPGKKEMPCSTDGCDGLVSDDCYTGN